MTFWPWVTTWSIEVSSGVLAEEVADHQPGSRFGRIDDAGNTGPRVGAGACEVKTAELLFPVVDPEPRALGEIPGSTVGTFN